MNMITTANATINNLGFVNQEFNQAHLLNSKSVQTWFSALPVDFFHSSEFWVYCESLEQSQDIKAKAQHLGFVNITTHDNSGCSKGRYYVCVKSSDICILDTSGQRWLDLYRNSFNSLSAHIIFTYAFEGCAFLVFNDEGAARTFHRRMQSRLCQMSRNGFSVNFSKEPNSLDAWRVSFSLDF
jgi:hypothetical protein